MITNPSEEAVKGQILWSDNNKNLKNIHAHFILYLEPMDAQHFVGAMITHSPDYGNIPMAVEHFIAPDKVNGYEVGYDNSYIVNRRLLKFHKWAPFKPVGMLSVQGIKFVQDKIGGTVPELFILNAP